jgi:hypothetical protein
MLGLLNTHTASWYVGHTHTHLMAMSAHLAVAGAQNALQVCNVGNGLLHQSKLKWNRESSMKATWNTMA